MVKKIIFLIAVILGFFSFFPVFAATYYVDGARVDDASNGSSWATAKKHIKSGIALMSGGDTLIVRDGVYSGINNNMCGNNGYEWVGIPSGNSGAYTTIKAENDFGVVIDGGGTLTGLYPNGLSYAVFQGLIFKNGGSNVYLYNCNHVKVLKCAGVEAAAGNTCNFNSAGGSYILFEDCFAWGRGRYKFLIGGGSTYTILRRCVGRYDYHDAENPHGVFSFYGNTNNVNYAQNCIAIDALSAPGYSTNAFYAPNGSTNQTFDSCIALNIQGWGNFFESGAASPILRNCVIWHGAFTNAAASQSYTSPINQQISSCTLGNFPYGVISENCSITDTIFYNIAEDAISWAENDYCNLNSNGNNYSNTNGGSHNILANPMTNGLEYLPRIEDGSALKTAGENGGQIGAQIIKRLGVSGALYEEAGWNTLTGENLWPWPNEDIIRTQMRSYDLHAVDGVRGFCSNTQTLTKYIWEYLGNVIPADIYGLRIATDSLTGGTVGSNYNQTVQVENGSLPYAWSITSGSLPSGLTLNTFMGIISGIPTQAGTYNFVLEVTDSVLAQDTQSFALVINNVGTSSGGGGGGCFIASAVYGDVHAKEVLILSEFKNKYLSTNQFGRLLVNFYYRVSPSIARKIERNVWAKEITRRILQPIIWVASKSLRE